MYGEKEFSRDAIEKFGGFIPELAEESEMLHSQMGYLAEGIREKITCTSRILDFLEALLLRGDSISEIENAVAISFIEIEEVSELGLATTIPPEIFRVLKEQQQRWLSAKIR